MQTVAFTATKDWQEFASGDGDATLSFGIRALGAVDVAIGGQNADGLNADPDFNNYIQLGGGNADFSGDLNQGNTVCIRVSASNGKNVLVRGYTHGNAAQILK